MYKQVETYRTAILHNGVDLTPIATLESESGGCAHIWIDDHCYQLGLVRDGLVKPTSHIFPEAFLVLKTLPDLISG